MTTRGESSRRTKRASWAFLFTLIVAAMTTFVAQPAAADDAIGYSLTFVDSVYDAVNDETTYTWQLQGPAGGDPASHVVIGTCLGNTAVDSDPDAAEFSSP